MLLRPDGLKAAPICSVGDLDDGGLEEVVTLLVIDGGDAFVYLVVMSEDAQGQLKQVAHTFLGGRRQV